MDFGTRSGIFVTIIVLCQIGLIQCGATRTKSIILFRELRNCPNQTGLGRLSCHTIDMIGGGRNAISGTIELTRPVQKITKLTAKVEKCNSYAERDKCEFLANIVIRDSICQMAKQKNMAWSPIIEAFQPELSCPLKNLKYVANNVTLDPGKFTQFVPNLENYYYIVTASVYENKARIMCVIFGEKLLKLRSPNKRIGETFQSILYSVSAILLSYSYPSNKNIIIGKRLYEQTAF